MKLQELFSHLSVAHREPIGSSIELARTLREGCAKLAPIEKARAKAAKADGYRGLDWGPTSFAEMLIGRSGPYGGADATPATVAFFVVGYLLQGRRDIAARTLDMMYATPNTVRTTHNHGWRLSEGPTCEKTGQRFFGGALMKLLSDVELLKQVEVISVTNELGFGVIAFKDFTMSQFAVDDRIARFPIGGRYSFYNLYPDMLVQVATIMIGDAEAAA